MSLVYIAGESAYEKIKDSGLKPDDVSTIPGAAGGPKFLVLSSIDRALFGTFFKGRKKPLYAVGSSIGSWRIAAYAQKNPVEAVSLFERLYIEQIHEKGASAASISKTSDRLLRDYVKPESIEYILNHPYIRTNIISDRGANLISYDAKPVLAAGIGLAIAANTVSSKGVHLFFKRTVFTDSRSRAPFLDANYPHIEVELTADNFYQAVLASGSIPLWMSGVRNIPGAPRGTYRDGGMTDYHMDIPYGDSGIVLYPHFSTTVKPGWFDRWLSWRKPDRKNMSNVVLVAPSDSFINSLPGGSIPNRKDFVEFAGNDAERIKKWSRALSLCDKLGNVLLEDIASGAISRKLQKM